MTKNIYKTLFVSVAAVLLFAGCDTNNTDNANNSFDAGITTNSSSWGSQLTDIPAEYDSIGKMYNKHFTEISFALHRKGFQDPTNDEIIYATKEYFKGLDPDFNTAVLDNVDINAIGDSKDSFNVKQQKIVSQINSMLETSKNASAFVNQIPTMVSLIYTLPSEDREQVFIYLAIAKYAVLDTSEFVLQGFWGNFFGKCCAVWGFINLITEGVVNVHPAGAALTGACAIYAFAS